MRCLTRINTCSYNNYDLRQGLINFFLNFSYSLPLGVTSNARVPYIGRVSVTLLHSNGYSLLRRCRHRMTCCWRIQRFAQIKSVREKWFGHMLKNRIYKKSFSTSPMCYYLLRQKKNVYGVCKCK